MKIISKKLKPYKGLVYDLTVKNTHTYNVQGLAVHNSGSGSLVLYTSGITGIDPIKYNLYFERFVSKARAKKIEVDGVTYLDGSLLCDIDNDIAYEKRQQVIDYIYQKYPSKTAAIMTYSTLSGKICIKECMKIVGDKSEEEANQVSDFIPKKFGKVLSFDDAEKESEKFKNWADGNRKILNIAKQIEGLIKNTSVHASGIAISNEDVSGVVPTRIMEGGGVITGFDMDAVASLMVKFDVLGLRTLSVIQDCCDTLGIDWKKINPEDQFIYDILQNLEDPKGIFQIEADATYEVCRKVKPKNLEELSAVMALSRPGALAFVDEYVDVKNQNKFIPERNPILDDILKKTNGIFIYQESLMRVAHDVFGLSLENAESIRRACGKKKRDEMKKWESKIRSQGKKLNIDEPLVDFYWNALIASADYSFNACLAPETLVETKDGVKSLFEVEAGDSILAYNIKEDKDHFVEVLQKHENYVDLYEIEMEDGTKIKCSMDHKFLCSDNKMHPLKEIISLNLGIVCK
jgi:DNA polymerase-3 subunit alpha